MYHINEQPEAESHICNRTTHSKGFRVWVLSDDVKESGKGEAALELQRFDAIQSSSSRVLLLRLHFCLHFYSLEKDEIMRQEE